MVLGLPRFIDNVFDAARIYLLSRGIAWFYFDAVVRVLNFF